MSDSIDVSSGGAIAVDTEVIRALIPRITDAADRLAAAERELHWAESLASPFRSYFAATPQHTALVSYYVPDELARARLRQRSQQLLDTAASIRLMADAYDIVEARMRARIQQLDGYPSLGEAPHQHYFVNPAALALANELEREWTKRRAEGFVAQAWGLWPLGPKGVVIGAGLLSTVPYLVSKYGNSIVTPGRRLEGEVPEVTVTPTVVAEDIIAPASTEEVIKRLPDGDAQVRVEVYTFPDGSRQYFAHIAGTRAFISDVEPWDMDSNLDLYYDEYSESLAAVEKALEMAGAEPGDVLHLSGHSQGAMNGAAVAMEGKYEVRTYVSAGGPVTPILPETTLAARFVHTDDAVAMLGGGGLIGSVGATGSVLVRRVGDPESGAQDLTVRTHHTDRYAETARMFDESGDPRVEQFAERWAELGEAESVHAIDFTATKVKDESGE